MIVLKWNQSRSKLVSQLSRLDKGIAKRADDLESGWNKQKDGAYVESDAVIANQKRIPHEVHTDEVDAADMPPIPDGDYLR